MIKKDIFLSHAWGKDGLDRDNHLRVKELSKKLIKCGYSVWFDDNDMVGNIDRSIIEGINKSSIVIFCLTTKYCDKLNYCINSNISNDNCYKEWNYTLFCKKKILPILMEPDMINYYNKNNGIVQMYLNNSLYIDFSNNFHDNFHKLIKSLQYYQVFPILNTNLCLYKNPIRYKIFKSKSLPNLNNFYYHRLDQKKFH